MDNKIVSTTYVPLDPPYQIIKYSRDIAMQIGTLIVTIQKEGNENGLGYKIETHSHPVVSYENKFKAKPNHQLTAYRFLEGAVWNFVEVKDVTTICLSNAILPWQEYVDFLWRDMEIRRIVSPMIFAFTALDKLCGGVEPPLIQHYVVKLEKHIRSEGGKKTPFIRSRKSDVLPLIVDATDKEQMNNALMVQIAQYSVALSSLQKPNDGLSISYETEEEDCRQLVQQLNSNPSFTHPFNAVINFGMDFLKTMR